MLKLRCSPYLNKGYARVLDADVSNSVELAPGVIGDYDAEDNLVGLEVLYLHCQPTVIPKLNAQEAKCFRALRAKYQQAFGPANAIALP